MSLFFPIVNKYKWWIKGIHKIKYKKFKSRISDDLWLDNIYYIYQYVLRSCGLHKRIKTHNDSNKNHTPSQIMEILFVLCFIIILMSKDALDITLSFTLTKLCSVMFWFNLQSNANQSMQRQNTTIKNSIFQIKIYNLQFPFWILFRFSKQKSTTFWNASIVPCWRIIYPFLAIWMTVEFDIAYQISNFLHICSSNCEDGDIRNSPITVFLCLN